MRIVTFGEGMIELTGALGETGRVGTGGDMLNAAVAFARLGRPPQFLSAVGHDGWSDMLVERWALEGVDPALVLRHPTRTAGIYAISCDADGERSFTYWRDHSAVRDLWACDGAGDALAAAARADLLLLSGQTLALFDEDGRRRAQDLLRQVRANGGRVAFDPNYRPSRWPSPDAALAAFSAVAALADVVLPSRDDMIALGESGEPAAIDALWRAQGDGEVVVKLGREGAWVAGSGFHPAREVRAVDTTGAGDAFDAGYCAARLAGEGVPGAVAMGQALAAAAVAHVGGLLPKGVEIGIVEHVSSSA